ncbi:MAG: hypothetical protein IPK58_07350 [Acidobacteria bacterium]|nr:hypothetical protein [Acidobacteriota bacterium]
MESFTHEGDFEESQPRSVKIRQLLLIGAAIVIALLLLRGIGAFRFDLGSYRISGTANMKRETTNLLNDGTATSNKKSANGEARKDGSLWNVGLGSGENAGGRDGLAERIKRGIESDPALRGFSPKIAVQEFEVSGMTWMPLVKSGKSSFKVTVEGQRETGKYLAEFAGNFEISATGFCSSDRLEVAVAEEIESQIRKSVKEDFNK